MVPLLDLVLTKREERLGNAMLQGSLGWSDQEMVFMIPRIVRRAHCKLTTLEFTRADFGLSKDLLGRVSLDRALEGRRVQKCWLNFKDQLLQAQDQGISTRSRLSKNTSMDG